LKESKEDGKVECLSYWAKSGTDTYTKKLLTSGVEDEFIGKVLVLIEDSNPNPVTFKYNPNVCLGNADLQATKQDLLVHLLLHSGYITGQVNYEEETIGASIPNKEIRQSFRSTLEGWLESLLS
jgi:hypothetical protein